MGLGDSGFFKIRVDAHLRVITMQKMDFHDETSMEDWFEYMKYKKYAVRAPASQAFASSVRVVTQAKSASLVPVQIQKVKGHYSNSHVLIIVGSNLSLI